MTDLFFTIEEQTNYPKPVAIFNNIMKGIYQDNDGRLHAIEKMMEYQLDNAILRYRDAYLKVWAEQYYWLYWVILRVLSLERLRREKF